MPCLLQFDCKNGGMRRMVIDTFPMSEMTFLLWVALHKYIHSVGVLGIWLKNSGTADTGHAGLSSTWLSGRTSINDSVGQILKTVNTVKKKKRSHFVCLKGPEFSLCLILLVHECQINLKVYNSSFLEGGNWGTKKWRFSLAFKFGGLIWGLIFRTENQDESSKECVK